MPGRLQGSARPGNVASRVASDTHVSPFSLDTSAPTSTAWRVEQLQQADQALFTAPFAVIDADNGSPQRVSAWSEAQAAMAAGMAVAGQLHPAVLAADVDPVDAEADPGTGAAVAEDLVSWAEDHGLPWLLRASGRPGGRHVVVLAPSASTAAALRPAWTRVCRWVSHQHQVPASPRRTVRLLSSPHRTGLAAPVLAAGLAPVDLPEPATTQQDAVPERGSGEFPRPRKPRHASKRSRTSTDRSRAEYGLAVAHARAGWTAEHAWRAVAVAGSKAAARGVDWWRRWVWAPATTVAAAEQGADADEAWRRFQEASSRRARHLGRAGWVATYWEPALVEAQQARPRRYRTGSGTGNLAEQREQHQEEITLVQAELRRAAADALNEDGRRPQFQRSVQAALDAVAEILVLRGGSVSERAWCESACVARETLRRVLSWLIERDILQRVRSYTGGASDSAAWQPTARVQSSIDSARNKTQTTRGTPHPRTRGLANSQRLAKAHSRERQAWSLRCLLSADTEASEQTYKNSDHPASRALRSLWFQKRWWGSLSAEQQEQRRRERRTELGQLHTSRRRQWFTWLAHRQEIVAAAGRVSTAPPDDIDSDPDWIMLGAAPRVLHRGLADPKWSDRTAATPPARQLELAA